MLYTEIDRLKYVAVCKTWDNCTERVQLGTNRTIAFKKADELASTGNYRTIETTCSGTLAAYVD